MRIIDWSADVCSSDLKADLDRAFSLQQLLDDATADTEEQVRAWRGEILSLTAAADEAPDAKAEAFDALRDLERNAPQELARTKQERAAVAKAEIGSASSGEKGTRTGKAPAGDVYLKKKNRT